MEKVEELMDQIIEECKKNDINCLLAVEDSKGFSCKYCSDRTADTINRLLFITEMIV